MGSVEMSWDGSFRKTSISHARVVERMTSFQKLAAAAASNATVHEVSVTKRKAETVLSNNTVDAAARHPPLTPKLHQNHIQRHH